MLLGAFRGGDSAPRGRSGRPPGFATPMVSTLEAFPEASVILTSSVTLALLPK